MRKYISFRSIAQSDSRPERDRMNTTAPVMTLCLEPLKLRFERNGLPSGRLSERFTNRINDRAYDYQLFICGNSNQFSPFIQLYNKYDINSLSAIRWPDAQPFPIIHFRLRLDSSPTDRLIPRQELSTSPQRRGLRPPLPPLPAYPIKKMTLLNLNWWSRSNKMTWSEEHRSYAKLRPLYPRHWCLRLRPPRRRTCASLTQWVDNLNQSNTTCCRPKSGGATAQWRPSLRVKCTIRIIISAVR